MAAFYFIVTATLISVHYINADLCPEKKLYCELEIRKGFQHNTRRKTATNATSTEIASIPRVVRSWKVQKTSMLLLLWP